jgi:hypothetical protein
VSLPSTRINGRRIAAVDRRMADFAGRAVNGFRPTAVNALVDWNRRLVTLGWECETCPR